MTKCRLCRKSLKKPVLIIHSRRRHDSSLCVNGQIYPWCVLSLFGMLLIWLFFISVIKLNFVIFSVWVLTFFHLIFNFFRFSAFVLHVKFITIIMCYHILLLFIPFLLTTWHNPQSYRIVKKSLYAKSYFRRNNVHMDYLL